MRAPLSDYDLSQMPPEVAEEIRRLRAQVAGHAERIAAQSEILSKRAETPAEKEAEAVARMLGMRTGETVNDWLSRLQGEANRIREQAIREAVAENRDRCAKAGMEAVYLAADRLVASGAALSALESKASIAALVGDAIRALTHPPIPNDNSHG